uniref:Uncharacterized protein n=1 Tax=Panagrolaimus sp. JU765 TaxID=591449 RepID=A0AC34R0X8_9BILA
MVRKLPSRSVHRVHPVLETRTVQTAVHRHALPEQLGPVVADARHQSRATGIHCFRRCPQTVHRRPFPDRRVVCSSTHPSIVECGLVLLVLVTFYIGNILTRKLAVQQKQIQKKQSITASMRLANERWKTGSATYSPIPGQGPPRPVKSTMMFRQFSGERRSKTKQWGPRQI